MAPNGTSEQALRHARDREMRDAAKWRSQYENAVEVNQRLLNEKVDLQQQLADVTTKEGPLNAERWTLDQLLKQLERWKQIAGGSTCVSFENLCYGASSLWHQTHRENFRAIDRKPDALSEWVLEHAGSVKADFPAQVLDILKRLHKAAVDA